VYYCLYPHYNLFSVLSGGSRLTGPHSRGVDLHCVRLDDNQQGHYRLDKGHVAVHPVPVPGWQRTGALPRGDEYPEAPSPRDAPKNTSVCEDVRCLLEPGPPETTRPRVSKCTPDQMSPLWRTALPLRWQDRTTPHILLPLQGVVPRHLHEARLEQGHGQRPSGDWLSLWARTTLRWVAD
jgi:hypothetical protein